MSRRIPQERANERGLVELTLRIGQYGERVETVAVPISDELAGELTEGMELSDEPFSLMLASLGTQKDYVTVRRKKFRMRREFAHEIARALEGKLMELFGADDVTDGYTKEMLRGST